MSAEILDGKSIAKQIRDELAVEVAEFIQNNGRVPKLAAVLVGDDPASQVYVRNKERACGKAGDRQRTSPTASRDDTGRPAGTDRQAEQGRIGKRHPRAVALA